MSRVEVTQPSAPLSDGILQTDLPLDGTPQIVKDQSGTSSTLLLATDETQVNSVLRVKTDNSELLDLEDNGSNNRFNINRDVQKINLDFASKPSDITTQVGAIRTAQDGVNLSDAVKFQENGQVTFTERVKIESDSTVSTQTSSVIQATTTNASLVLSPNGTGAIIASVPDGTATGGNARGANAVDLQPARITNSCVASGGGSIIIGGYNNTASNTYSTVLGGSYNNCSGQWSFAGGSINTVSGSYSTAIGGTSNTASSNYSTISGGQSNTASTNTHATVVGGQSNTSSGQHSVSGGNSSVASGNSSIALGYLSTASGSASLAIGFRTLASGQQSVALNGGNQVNTTASGAYSLAHGFQGTSYLRSMRTLGNSNSNLQPYNSNAQSSEIVSHIAASLTTAATTVLSLDGTGTTNLIIPDGNNRAWNVTSSWVAVVTAITGTATGITVGDVVTSVDLLGFKRVGGISSASAHTSAATKLMVTNPAQYAGCSIAYTAGASNEMALTFTGPTFVGGGSVTMRVVARIELSEVAW